jgi:hypothetical protein
MVRRRVRLIHFRIVNGCLISRPVLRPWQGLSSGEIECLKLHYRLQLTEQGFILVYQHVATFSAAQR